MTEEIDLTHLGGDLKPEDGIRVMKPPVEIGELKKLAPVAEKELWIAMVLFVDPNPWKACQACSDFFDKATSEGLVSSHVGIAWICALDWEKGRDLYVERYVRRPDGLPFSPEIRPFTRRVPPRKR